MGVYERFCDISMTILSSLMQRCLPLVRPENLHLYSSFGLVEGLLLALLLQCHDTSDNETPWTSAAGLKCSAELSVHNPYLASCSHSANSSDSPELRRGRSGIHREYHHTTRPKHSSMISLKALCLRRRSSSPSNFHRLLRGYCSLI